MDQRSFVVGSEVIVAAAWSLFPNMLGLVEFTRAAQA